MKNHGPFFEWDPETGTASCILIDGENIFIGSATCAPEDRDMMSEKTGYHIAQYRAQISYLKHLRDNVLKPRLAALKQLYFSINKSKYFNDKSYETKMIRRQIYMTSSDLDLIKEDLAELKQELNAYLEEKGKFYKRIRENRQKDKNN